MVLDMENTIIFYNILKCDILKGEVGRGRRWPIQCIHM
jgi:hypothetical protein